MKQLLMLAVLVGFAMPAMAGDDMNMTDTRAEFTVRKVNKGKYNPAMHKGAHKKALKMEGKKKMKKAK